MPKPIDDVLEVWKQRLRASGEPIIKFNWAKAYQDNGLERWKPERQAALSSRAGAHGLIIGFGNNVVSVTHDAV